jgi:hypothetical protein
MNTESNSQASGAFRNRVALGLVVLGAVSRLLPHPPNFSPVGGMSLFAGARVRGWQAYLVPLLLMAVTDPILSRAVGFPAYSYWTLAIYASFLINVWIGRRILRNRISPSRFAGAVLLGSVQFFLITNFAWFQISGMYSLNWAGVVASYVAALPFFGWTLAGDFVYAGAFFGLHAWLERYAPQQHEEAAQRASA